MAPTAKFSKTWKKRPIGGQDTIMGNYRIPKKNYTVADEERKRQRLRDTRNLATGIEIALKNLLPNDSQIVNKVVWSTHDSLAVDIELGIDSRRTDFLGARIVDSATSKGRGREDSSTSHGGLNDGGRNFQGVPLGPRSMVKYWSVLDQGKIPDHPYEQDPRDSNRFIGVPRPALPAYAPDSNNGESFSGVSRRTTYPYLQDPTDPNRLIGVPRPRLPAWATRPNYRKSGFENSVRATHPYLQDPSDPNKFVGVPRPFDWKDQNTSSDHYTGPAFYENRRRQIELGLVPSIYPDHWISGQTFGDDEKDIFSAKRLHEKEQRDLKGNAGVGPSDDLDRDGDVLMTQGPGVFVRTTPEAEILTPTPVSEPLAPVSVPLAPFSALPTPVSSVCGSLIQVLDGFRIDDEVVLDTPETVKARQDFFAEVESDKTTVGPVGAPTAGEGCSGNNAISSSLVDLADSRASDTASTSILSRIGTASSMNTLLCSRIEKMQPYRTSSVVGSTYAPTASSGASDFDGHSHKSGLGAPSQKDFGRYKTPNYGAASKSPSTLFSYAGSSASRDLPFGTMIDSVLANAIDIPVLEPTPAPKSTLFAGHAANLRAPMSHNEKVSQWAASIVPSGNTNGQPASPSRFSSANKAPVEFILPRKGVSGTKAATLTAKPNSLPSNDLLEMAGGEDGDMYTPPSRGKH
ncbi:hypothetical protein HOY82DRAFT_668676 [Tuber indicum]|nr:hypothetical protein HOY82DRAFT_668676 [Tuber indicum]